MLQQRFFAKLTDHSIFASICPVCPEKKTHWIAMNVKLMPFNDLSWLRIVFMTLILIVFKNIRSLSA